ncbi:MAG: ABC transporter substrate-binding protein [Chloroflexota bacterium]
MTDGLRPHEVAEYDHEELVFHPDGRITRKQLLLAGGGAVLGVASGPLLFSGVTEAMSNSKGVKLPYRANTNVKGNLTFWHFWSSPLRRGAVRAAIAQFQHAYPHIKVQDLPIPFGDIFNKIHASVAAQSGVPDVVVADRPSFWVDARSRVYTPLTAYNLRDKVSGKVFYPFTWQESNVKVKGKNQLFGLPFETDIRVMHSNRAVLLDAGFRRPPATWAEVKSYADKLDQKNGGQYSVLTMYPTEGQGLDSWVWTAKGGGWQTGKMYPTANSAANISAADWIQSMGNRYGGPSAFNYLQSQNQPGRDAFASGHLLLHVDTPSYQDFTLNSNGVKFVRKSGVADYPYWWVSPVPHGPGGKPYSFSGGFAIGVPRNDHRSHGNADAAWEFTKFMALVGQLTFERYAGNIPCVVNMTRDPGLRTKPNWSSFIAALKYGHRKDRNTFDPLYPGDVEVPAQDAILNGKSPKDALDSAQSQALTNMKRNGGP